MARDLLINLSLSSISVFCIHQSLGVVIGYNHLHFTFSCARLLAASGWLFCRRATDNESTPCLSLLFPPSLFSPSVLEVRFYVLFFLPDPSVRNTELSGFLAQKLKAREKSERNLRDDTSPGSEVWIGHISTCQYGCRRHKLMWTNRRWWKKYWGKRASSTLWIQAIENHPVANISILRNRR